MSFFAFENANKQTNLFSFLLFVFHTLNIHFFIHFIAPNGIIDWLSHIIARRCES